MKKAVSRLVALVSILTLVVVITAVTVHVQGKLPPQAQRTFSDPATYVPDVKEAGTTSELRDLVSRYSDDLQMMQRFHSVSGSKTRAAKLRSFHSGWSRELESVPFETLSQQGKVDYVLLRDRIEHDLVLVDRDVRVQRAIAPLVPFAEEIVRLQEARERLELTTADAAVSSVEAILARVRKSQQAVDAGTLTATPAIAIKAARHLEGLEGTLRGWFDFYNGYDPAFTKRVPKAFDALTSALDHYAETMRKTLAKLPEDATIRMRRPDTPRSSRDSGRTSSDATSSTGRDDDPPLALGQPIVGDPIGRDALLEDLRGEMIVYTPEQLIEIGTREYAWTVAEMKKASRALGFGDDWRKALEKVKEAYVPRGKQPELVRNLQIQAETFVRERDLVTIPPIVHDSWRMAMMEPRRMRSAPFFLGGERILVSYPVEGMSDELSTMIMKGNGPHLSHATVFHELIPGHGLQGFMAQRYNAHRRLFNTPFYTEGWALYWELLLWDLGFHQTPEDRIGALFWRMHRAARIIFTLNYQMGKWTPQQCVDFLVSNGHERYTAEGEVRGHVQGSTPLYQISYLMGALQLRSIYQDIVVRRKAMTTKAFNDAVLRTGQMPMEMVRALLTNRPLTRDSRAEWKFYGDVPAAGSEEGR
ncbi:MAG: DUF885 family protein [Vicinamibacteraceae bacterium]